MAVLALMGLPRAAAEDAEGLRVYSEELRVELDQQVPERREVGVDGGGWLNFALFSFDEPADDTHRTLRQYQLRGWASFNVRGVHQGYVRGLLNWDDWGAGDNTAGGLFTERVERAWYQLDLGRLLAGEGGEPALAARVKAGREYAEIGTALVLSMPLDMVRLELSGGDWSLAAMLAMAVEKTPNIDDSELVADRQERCFWGLELACEAIDAHRPFLYYLSNDDHTTPISPDPDQSYEYSSRYVGLGSEGVLRAPELRYQVEVVGEWGKTFSEGARYDRERICALAADVLLEYLFQSPAQPRLSAEYLFGSGDGDRRTSATATEGGNRAGTDDTAFNSFGFRDTGIALAPAISNIHIFAVGGSFFPLPTQRPFEKMELGAKVFLYNKARASGAISVPGAANGHRWVGWEADVYCNWRLTSDLAVTVRYGAFQPGSAFADKSWRQFLYSGVIFSL